MKPDRYRNCYIGKDGINEKHLLQYDDYTQRYTSEITQAQGLVPHHVFLTADEIDMMYFVYSKDGELLN